MIKLKKLMMGTVLIGASLASLPAMAAGAFTILNQNYAITRATNSETSALFVVLGKNNDARVGVMFEADSSYKINTETPNPVKINGKYVKMIGTGCSNGLCYSIPYTKVGMDYLVGQTKAKSRIDIAGMNFSCVGFNATVKQLIKQKAEQANAI